MKNFIISYLYIVAIVTLMCHTHIISAQTRTGYLSGKVIDDSRQKPLSGASIFIEETKKGTVSDKNGNFSFSGMKPGTYTVTVQYMGYCTYTRKLTILGDGGKTIYIRLKNEVQSVTEVVVKGKMRERKSIAEVRRSGMPVSVIDGKMLSARGTTIEEVLNHQTGIKIRRTGGVGSETKINVRGLEGKRVQTYVDGYALRSADGNFSINDIPLQFIDRIEVYKGIVPPEFGGDGLGSAINVVTIDPEKGYVDAEGNVGSYGCYKGNITVRKRIPALKTYVSGFIGGTWVKNDYKMKSPFEEGLTIKRDHDRLKMLQGALTLKSKELYFDNFEIENFFYINHKQVQGIKQNIRHAETWGRTFGINPKMEKTDFLAKGLDMKFYGLIVRSTLGMRDTANTITDFHGNVFPCPYGGEVGMIPNNSHDTQTDYRYAVNLKYHIISDRMTLNLNNDFRTVHTVSRDTVADRFLKQDYSGLTSDIYTMITSLSVQNKWFGKRLTSVLTGRHYYYALKGNTVNLSSAGDAHPKHSDTHGNYYGASLALRYSLSNEWLVKFAVERNYRLPSYEEALGDRMTTLTSIDLKPEHALNFNIGAMQDRYYGVSSRIQFETNAYLSKIKNMVYPTDYIGFILYKNLGEALMYGADAEIKWDIDRRWYVSTNITWQKCLDNVRNQLGTSSPSITYRKQIPNIPIFFVNWTTDYRTDNLLGGRGQYTRFYYEGGFTDRYYFGFKLADSQEYVIPSTVLHTVGIEWGFKNRKILIGAELHNIFNTSELTNFNYPLPGRTFMIKLRFTTLD